MNQAWQQQLERDGARFGTDGTADFGDSAAELDAARNDATSTIVVPLLHLGVIRAGGDDAATFLHSLFTNDVQKLGPQTAQYNSMCSAKGRMLTSFLVWREGGDILLQLSRELQPAIQKKLGMYVLRSKVKLSDASDERILIGLAGSGADTALAQLGAQAPTTPLGIGRFDGGCVIRLDARRFCVAVDAGVAGTAWTKLRSQARPAGTEAWRWLEIVAGIPLITPTTQEQFVPQMTNFELIGGVSFNKGCYPGQEIVARTQYLGKLKRRMYLAHLDGNAAPQFGSYLYSPDLPDQSCGMVVNAAPAPGGGYDLLAVVQMSSADGDEVRLDAPDGPRLAFRTLPYTAT